MLIIAIARHNIGLARFLPGSALELAFSGDDLSEVSLRGRVNAKASDAVARADGGVVASGHVGLTFSSRDSVIARYRRDDSLDPRFRQQGFPSLTNAIVVSPTGNVTLVGAAQDPAAGNAGQAFALARYSDIERIFSSGFD